MKRLLSVLLVLIPAIAWGQNTVVSYYITGTINANGGSVIVNATKTGNGTIDITGGWVGTLQIEGTVDGSNWVALAVVPVSGGTAVSATTANGTWQLSSAMAKVRVRASAWTSGTANVALLTTSARGGQGGGGGGGGGTVTQVGTGAPLTGGPVTGTGTISCPTCTTNASAATANSPMIGAGGQAIATGTRSGNTTTFATTTGALTNGHIAAWDASGNLVDGGTGGGSGTVTNVATTSPVTGGPFTTTGTIACPTCTTSASALTSGLPLTGGSGQAITLGAKSGTTTTFATTSGTLTNAHIAVFDASGNLVDGGVPGGTGTVTNVATSGPITGGPFTTTGTIGCATCTTNASALTSGLPVVGAAGQAVSVATKSGTTTSFATTSGTLTSAHLAVWDASGNLVDGGVPGSGGGNTTSTSLTSNVLPKSNGANSIINSLVTDDGTSLTYTGSGGVVAPSVSTSGSGESFLSLTEGTGQAVSAAGKAKLIADGTTHKFMVSNNGGTYTALDPPNKRRTCVVTIGDPGAASLALANDNDAPAACPNDYGSDWTITMVACTSDTITGAPVADVKFSGGASILTGTIACGAQPTYVGGTLSGTPVVHSFSGTGGTCSSTPCSLGVDITPGGTAKYIVVKVTGTLP